MFKKTSILVDNESWILPYALSLNEWLNKQNITSKLVFNQQDIPLGDICFLIGCTQRVQKAYLERNTHNLVVHESDLPLGKGFAPIAWQILERKNIIPICLIEANTEFDSGDIWLKDEIHIKPYDLSSDWRKKQGEMTVKIAQEFIKKHPHITPTPQQGEASTYPRRSPKDSELDINRSIKEQFELLQVVDNNDYPAFFIHKGKRFRLKIFRDE